MEPLALPRTLQVDAGEEHGQLRRLQFDPVPGAGLGRSGVGPSGVAGASGPLGANGVAGRPGSSGPGGFATGAGVFVSGSGSVSFYNATIAENLGGGIYQNAGSVTLYNTLAYANSMADFVVAGGTATTDFSLLGITVGTITQHNPVQGDPGLGSLTSKRGPTQTISITVGGAADGTGSNGVTGVTLLTDQRGYVPTDGAWDVGAFQAEAEPRTTALATHAAGNARLQNHGALS
jgi:hypothetical protein